MQLFHMGWDHHGGLPRAMRGQVLDTDRVTGAPLDHLSSRSLLDETLIGWGGEFGRTIYSQGSRQRITRGSFRRFSDWLSGTVG